MKRHFFLFGLSALSVSSLAQQNDGHNHLADKFGISVFRNSHTLNPLKRADIGVNEKLSKQFPGWVIATNKWTGGFKELNGKPMNVSGSTLLEKANYLLKNQLSVAGIRAEEWVLDQTFTNNKGYTYLYFRQEVAGQKVVFAKMHFRFSPDGKIARINSTEYGHPDASITASITPSEAVINSIAEMDGAIITNKEADKDLVWFPIPNISGYQLHPAFRVKIEGQMEANSSAPLSAIAYVDALNGEILYRDNETKDAADIKIVGSIYTDGYLNPTKVVGLNDLAVSFGATSVITNDTGLAYSAGTILPTVATINLQGPWSRVRSAPDANITPTFTRTITTSGTVDSFDASTKSTSRHINAFYHVNTVHDHMKKMYGTSFTGMDFSLPTNVDVTGTCNAFYTAAGGGSINFYPAGGGCVSFAEVRDVVYHEYGHAIVSKMYSGGMQNGGLNEGQADIWGMSITGDSILARGAYGTAGSYIRRYDLAPKVFPADLTGEVHANGEIIAGAWWDYSRNVKSTDSMATLFSATLLNEKPDGANGTEGEVFHEMLMGALVNDDDDANLANGTPHFTEIVTAFARHGIYLLQDLTINHNELAHQKEGLPITVTATAVVSNPIFFENLYLVYRERGGTWTSLKMTDAGGFNFSATIPAMTAGTIVDYYFSAEDIVNLQGIFGPENYFPTSVISETKSTLYYQFAVGVSPQTVIDFESTLPAGWLLGIGTDNATAGKWVQVVPIGTSNGGLIVQTNSDHTTGSGKCLVTGNATGSAYTQSVKNGSTTIQTPVYDISSYTNPIVEYYRWFSNDRGRNPKKEIWRVSMATTSTSVFYKDIDNTNQSDHQWRRRIFKPRDLFPSTNTMMIKFLATENIPTGGTQNGLVEAAVDDFVIYEGTGSSSVANTQKTIAKIYPNPSSDYIFVELPAETNNSSIKFYDISGRHLSTVATTKGNTRYQIDVKSMVAGQYLMVIEMDNMIQNHTITIAK